MRKPLLAAIMLGAFAQPAFAQYFVNEPQGGAPLIIPSGECRAFDPRPECQTASIINDDDNQPEVFDGQTLDPETGLQPGPDEADEPRLDGSPARPGGASD